MVLASMTSTRLVSDCGQRRICPSGHTDLRTWDCICSGDGGALQYLPRRTTLLLCYWAQVTVVIAQPHGAAGALLALLARHGGNNWIFSFRINFCCVCIF